MKKLILCAMILTLTLTLALPAFATSLYGMKGLIYMPIADTQPQGKFGVNFQVTTANSNYLGFNYGFFENFEGYLSMENTNGFSGTNWAGGVKFRALQETNIQPSLAIGTLNKDIYVVASKTMDLKSTIRGHIGFGNGQLNGLFFGFNKIFNPVNIRNSGSGFMMPVTNVKLEYFIDEINLGTDIYLNEHFTVSLGLLNFRGTVGGFSYTSDF